MDSVIFLFMLSTHAVLAVYVRSIISPEATWFKNRTMINSVPNVYASYKNKLVFFLNSNKTDEVAIKTLSYSPEYTVVHSFLPLEKT